jgi:hypothetical protein
MKRMNRLFILFIFLVVGNYFQAQKFKQERYKNFDKRTFHFGFMLGFNSSDFTVYQDVNAYENYGLKLLENDAQPGGQLGILTTMKLGTPVLRLRFIPTLSFQEKLLRYTFEDTLLNTDQIGEERVNSTNLDFPLMLQFRTKRYNNFTAYALVGGQYSIDLQSQEKASQNYIDPYIKIKRNDVQGQIGGGVEFFAPYFKFGIELKYSHGFINSFIRDDTNIAAPINKLYNKVWSLSLIFEG